MDGQEARQLFVELPNKAPGQRIRGAVGSVRF